MERVEFKQKLKQLRADVVGHYPKIEALLKKNKTPFDVSTISRVLKGDWINNDVIEAAIQVRNDLKKQEQKIADKI